MQSRPCSELPTCRRPVGSVGSHPRTKSASRTRTKNVRLGTKNVPQGTLNDLQAVTLPRSPIGRRAGCARKGETASLAHEPEPGRPPLFGSAQTARKDGERTASVFQPSSGGLDGSGDRQGLNSCGRDPDRALELAREVPLDAVGFSRHTSLSDPFPRSSQ